MARKSTKTIANDPVDEHVLSEKEEIPEPPARRIKHASKSKKEKVDVKEPEPVSSDEEQVSDAKSIDDSSEELEDKPLKKLRKVKNLQSVVDLLEDGKNTAAIKLLKTLIEKHGPDLGKKKAVAADAPKKPMSDYNRFIQSAIAEIRESRPEVEPKNRLVEAVKMWKEKKLNAA